MTSPAPLIDPAALAAFTDRDPTDTNIALAATLAEDLILGVAGGRITSPPQPGIRAVAFTVAARMLAGPVGVTSESDGAVSIGYTAGSGALALTREETATVSRLVGRAGVYAMPIYLGDET